MSYILICLMLFGWTKPTGREKIIKKWIENVSYSVEKIKDPSPSDLYLTLKCRATGDEVDLLKREVEVKKEIPVIAPILVSALGIYGGLSLSKTGMVVLSRDIGILSIGSGIGMLLFNMQKPHKIWQKIKRRKRIIFIPDKPFTVKLLGTEYTTSILPDKRGILKINILQFAPFYKENVPFYVNIFSPEGKNLGTFRVNTAPIAKNLIRGLAQKGTYTPPPVLTVDVDVNIPQTKMENPDAIAVIIGNKDYEKPGVPNVEFAENDAEILKDYLIKTLGFKEENIIPVLNARKSDFEVIFGTKENYKGKLYNYVKPHKSDVFVYYSGHGAPDPKTKTAYFVPVDCDPDYVDLNGYPLDLFYKNLSKIPAKSITVVIDACFSGASEKGMLIASASPIGVVPITKVVGNINVFTSSRGDEISSWYPQKRHSLFTYYFLKGLQGNADENKDGKITFGELADYANGEVSYQARRLFNREQVPQFRGNKSMVLLRLR